MSRSSATKHVKEEKLSVRNLLGPFMILSFLGLKGKNASE